MSCKRADSQTGRYLMHAIKHPLQKRRIVEHTLQSNTWIDVQGANMHNLQNVNVQIPLQRLVAITGVSGSGKSTLAREVMLTNVHAAVAQKATKAGRDAAAAGKSSGYGSVVRTYQAMKR
jgi:excinuclease ABC subunit A